MLWHIMRVGRMQGTSCHGGNLSSYVRPRSEFAHVMSSLSRAGQVDLLNCEYDPPTQFDTPDLLAKLYGEHFDPNDSSGHGNIVVLGAHNSGTSMVTRLIMLLGAFAGNFETISIHRHNKLKYYEQFAVSLFHDAWLGKFVDTRFRPYHGQGLDFSSLSDADQEKLNVRPAPCMQCCSHPGTRRLLSSRRSWPCTA